MGCYGTRSYFNLEKEEEIMRVTINNEALAKALGYRVSDVITIEDKGGVPLNREWRNRLRDSETDQCVTVVTAASKERIKK